MQKFFHFDSLDVVHESNSGVDEEDGLCAMIFDEVHEGGTIACIGNVLSGTITLF